MAKRELPPSREVRLTDGVTEGFPEHIAFSIYSGNTESLLEGIVAIELVIESKRANAARNLATILKRKLAIDGYLVASDIDNGLEDFLQSEVDI